jgi:hypothetical protein
MGLNFSSAKSVEVSCTNGGRDCFLPRFALGHRSGVFDDARLYDLVGPVAWFRNCWGSFKRLPGPQSEKFDGLNYANGFAPEPVLSGQAKRTR